jgi:Mn2+/Fe2+ NRAMP family transporter
MGAVMQMLLGGDVVAYTLGFGLICVVLEIFLSYRRYSAVLKFTTLSLFAYIAVVFTVHLPWGEALRGVLVPHVEWTTAFATGFVAILGTTISPYLFFWQASQEVEEMRRGRPSQPLKELTRGGNAELRRITVDTTAGMILSNAVAYFIILTTAATLHAHGQTDIQTAADAASALRPIAGELTFFLFALGIIGTGLLAIPVLAGSAAYVVAGAFGWPSTLEAKFPEAVGFYIIILAATIIGFSINFTPVDPIRLLVWSAVVNGVVAVPVMAMMMLLASRQAAMGRFRVRSWLAWTGWGATAVMALSVAALVLSFVA